MNVQTKVKPPDEPAIKPFNAYAAYQEAREENRVLWDALSRSLALNESNADRLESRGVDVSHVREFVRNIRARVLG